MEIANDIFTVMGKLKLESWDLKIVQNCVEHQGVVEKVDHEGQVVLSVYSPSPGAIIK